MVEGRGAAATHDGKARWLLPTPLSTGCLHSALLRLLPAPPSCTATEGRRAIVPSIQSLGALTAAEPNAPSMMAILMALGDSTRERGSCESPVRCHVISLIRRDAVRDRVTASASSCDHSHAVNLSPYAILGGGTSGTRRPTQPHWFSCQPSSGF